MAFIKVEDVVINTTYIAVVKLDGQNAIGEEIVALLVAIPNFPLAQQAEGNACRYEWIEFSGMPAIALRDYFSSFNNVVDLLPQNYSDQNCVDIKAKRRIRTSQ